MLPIDDSIDIISHLWIHSSHRINPQGPAAGGASARRHHQGAAPAHAPRPRLLPPGYKEHVDFSNPAARQEWDEKQVVKARNVPPRDHREAADAGVRVLLRARGAHGCMLASIRSRAQVRAALPRKRRRAVRRAACRGAAAALAAGGGAVAVPGQGGGQRRRRHGRGRRPDRR